MSEVDSKGDAAVEKPVQETTEAVAPVSNGDTPAGDAPKTAEEAKSDTKEEVKAAEPELNTTLPESEEEKATLKAKIIRQIEYYFGDINLSRDRFLKEQITLDNGWVSKDIMLKFKRLVGLTGNWEFITQCLKDSSQLMEISECGDKLRRTPSKPLPADTKERKEDITSRTVYVKRFPLEVGLDELLPFFEAYGPTDNLVLKRNFQTHKFKGSVFVTYKSKVDGQKFIDEEGTKFKETALEAKLWKLDYFKLKPGREGKRKAEKDTDDGEPKEKQARSDRFEGVDADDVEQVKNQMTKGSVLHLSGMNEETDREEVRALFMKHGDVSWVDFNKGVTEGYLRLKEPGSAETTLESLNKMEGGIMLHDTKVTVRVVDGEEELQYWQKMYRDMAERRQNRSAGGHKKFRGRGGGRGGRNRGGRGRGRGGRRD